MPNAGGKRQYPACAPGRRLSSKCADTTQRVECKSRKCCRPRGKPDVEEDHRQESKEIESHRSHHLTGTGCIHAQRKHGTPARPATRVEPGNCVRRRKVSRWSMRKGRDLAPWTSILSVSLSNSGLMPDLAVRSQGGPEPNRTDIQRPKPGRSPPAASARTQYMRCRNSQPARMRLATPITAMGQN